jgi:hypothetical protein
VTSRIRTIKPEFFTDEDLAELSIETRLLFVALWTIADREGRLEDKPRTIKLASFPWDDVDVARCLDALASGGFIERYAVSSKNYIQITNFTRHQCVNHREQPSRIPPRACPGMPVLAPGELEGKGREGKGTGREGRVVDASPSPERQLAISARMQAESARVAGDIKAEQRFLNQAANFERRAGEAK